MQLRICRALLAVALLSGCATQAFADPDQPTTIEAPPTTVAPEVVSIPPLVIEAPAPDPTHCFDGTQFVRVTFADFKCVAPRPMTIAQMVAAVGLPPIFATTIIPRESGGNPRARNRYDCRGLTQHCGKASLYRQLGYTWDDAFDPMIHLRVTKVLFDRLGLAPWRCGRCSLH